MGASASRGAGGAERPKAASDGPRQLSPRGCQAEVRRHLVCETGEAAAEVADEGMAAGQGVR